jgi:predicted RNase H-like nuclease (RuvC/YqgF family)
MAKRSSDDFDTDHTDELPVLLETVVLQDAVEPLLTERHDDRSEHTVSYSPAAAGSAARLAELAERAEQIPSLEAQIRVVTDSARDFEQRVAEKDRQLEKLNDSLASLRRSAEDSAAAERHLEAQVAIRDAQLAELAANVERLGRDGTAAAAELDQLRTLAAAAHRETEALRGELAARPTRAAASPDVQELREDHAALATYIASRRAAWDDMQTTNTRLAARVAALEHELKAAAKRLAAAEALANRESGRAVALRAELVDAARRVDSLERELRLAREPAEPPPQAPVLAKDGAPPPASTDSASVSAAAASASEVRAARAAPSEAPPVLTDAVDTAAPAVEAIAQLEAEVEYKRQQVAAQLVELREREQRLRAATSELEQMRRELGALRIELDDSRTDVARLERAVIDKDRALAARDARIATLHDELKHRAGAEKRSATGFALPAVDAAATARAGARDGAGEHTAAPALLCLTGDAPKRFALTKKTTTLGRGPHCDLQILTHFVSREHARLTVNAEATVIEDLGSRNGVFVNAVRVDCRTLRQGDLVTIGETQFRFVESMAH